MSKNQKDFFKKKNEWSKIKDDLLACYLPQYFQKLLTTRRPIYYVDCFAGKGKFEDGNPGSPLIAMNTIKDCLAKSCIRQKRNAIRPYFIELNHASELQKNIDSVSYPNKDIEPHIIGGKFEEHIRDILRGKSNCNVFLYVDPYGIQALDLQLFDELGTYGFSSFEMLINFNSFGFFRDACRVMRVDASKDSALQNLEELVEYDPAVVTSSPQSENLLTKIAGGDYWKDIVKDFQSKKLTVIRQRSGYRRSISNALRKGTVTF